MSSPYDRVSFKRFSIYSFHCFSFSLTPTSISLILFLRYLLLLFFLSQNSLVSFHFAISFLLSSLHSVFFFVFCFLRSLISISSILLLPITPISVFSVVIIASFNCYHMDSSSLICSKCSDPCRFLILFSSFWLTRVLIVALLGSLTSTLFCFLTHLHLTKWRVDMFITNWMVVIIDACPKVCFLSDMMNLLYSFFMKMKSMWLLQIGLA